MAFGLSHGNYADFFVCLGGGDARVHVVAVVLGNERILTATRGNSHRKMVRGLLGDESESERLSVTFLAIGISSASMD